jgi:hypothetical protein
MSPRIRASAEGSSRSAWFIGVSIHPGAIAFTRTPTLAHSSAHDFVRFVTAAFAVP